MDFLIVGGGGDTKKLSQLLQEKIVLLKKSSWIKGKVKAALQSLSLKGVRKKNPHCIKKFKR